MDNFSYVSKAVLFFYHVIYAADFITAPLFN